MLSDLYRGYVLKNLYSDVSKFLRKNLKDIEWDREYWLNKAGLTQHRPGRAAAGSASLFLLGLVAGGIAALAFAPKTGVQLRAEVKDKARELMDRATMKIEQGQEARA